MPLPRPITIANTRYLKDDVNSYSSEIIEIAKRLDANHILLSFTGTSGEDKERWNWRLIKPFVRQCHDEGLFVAFYMKLTNINWKPMFHRAPRVAGVADAVRRRTARHLPRTSRPVHGLLE